MTATKNIFRFAELLRWIGAFMFVVFWVCNAHYLCTQTIESAAPSELKQTHHKSALQFTQVALTIEVEDEDVSEKCQRKENIKFLSAVLGMTNSTAFHNHSSSGLSSSPVIVKDIALLNCVFRI